MACFLSSHAEESESRHGCGDGDGKRDDGRQWHGGACGGDGDGKRDDGRQWHGGACGGDSETASDVSFKSHLPYAAVTPHSRTLLLACRLFIVCIYTSLLRLGSY